MMRQSITLRDPKVQQLIGGSLMKANLKWVVIVLLLVAACTRYPTQQVYQGVDIKVVSIERMSEWKQGMMSTTRPRNPGDDVAVVHLEFRSTGGQKQIKFDHSEIVLIDSQGNKHNAEEDLTFTVGGGQPLPWEIAFAVPKVAGLKTLQLGGARFDVENIKLAQSSQK
jgi:hypothetical protein